AGLRPKPDVRLAIRCVTCESTGKSVIRTAPDTLSARRDVTLVRPPRPRLRLTKGLDGHLAGRRCYRAESPGARSPAPTGRARWPLPFSALEIDVSQAQVSDDDIFGGHEGGKLSVSATRPITQARDLSIAYTPGVAKVSRAIEQEPALAKRYTWADRLVAVVSDGSAVLGLGDIGASASLPVMEGKSVLFKTFAGLDSIPLVLETSGVDEIVETLVRLRPSFGAVNLEDVSAPRCFELEAKLKDALDCPVMHDDQHGTAIVVLAALRGANLVTGRDIGDQRVVISGAGAAGVECTKILQAAGVGDVTVLDSRGIIHEGRDNLNDVKRDLAATTNKAGLRGGLADAMAGADVFIGLSSATIDENLLATMAPEPIVFALSNPDPEVHPETAAKYAAVVATGR